MRANCLAGLDERRVSIRPIGHPQHRRRDFSSGSGLAFASFGRTKEGRRQAFFSNIQPAKARRMKMPPR